MIEAMKQALEALKDVGVLTDREWQAVHKNKANELRQAIREHAMYEVQRLGQEIEQEPVAWMREDATLRFADGKIFVVGQPFYTHPPQRKPLTDEQVEKIIKANMSFQMNLAGIRQDFEAAYGIKK